MPASGSKIATLDDIKSGPVPFKLETPYAPAGDQPQAIEALVSGLERGKRFQVLRGVTGSGKTFTMAGVIARYGKPALIVSHNKTLTAQLFSEVSHFFPSNEVHYFVSFYDYYQPESYIPHSDTYIEKDSAINDRIDRLRIAATAALLSRPDSVVVASVSCIYGLGSPADFKDMILVLKAGQSYPQKDLLKRLVKMQYENGSTDFKRGTFRVRGDVVEIHLAHATVAYRLEFFGDELERIIETDPVSGRVLKSRDWAAVYPAKHYVTPDDKRARAIQAIEAELESRLAEMRAQGKELYAERLKSRTLYDLEMLTEIGYCKGIENYSRHFSGRAPGEPPYTLLDFFPRKPDGTPDFLTIIDESHVTIPQLHAMLSGDKARKASLVDYGFRLPCAFDNRPLSFDEFFNAVGPVIFCSATPGDWELERAGQVVDQIVRPTGLLDPEIEIRPVDGQVDDLIREIRATSAAGERVLVTTLTKRMAEDLTEFLSQANMRVKYLHSDVDTLDRIRILRDLRMGRFDVLVGINLLREGLDLPEVSLVAILDADKEGFLRSKVSLIQTMGRAARHVRGRVILYADKTTQAMQDAVRETARRRERQKSYNEAHNITPKSVRSAIKDDLIEQDTVIELAESVKSKKDLVKKLESEMFAAADALDFEKAAALRDLIAELEQGRRKNAVEGTSSGN